MIKHLCLTFSNKSKCVTHPIQIRFLNEGKSKGSENVYRTHKMGQIRLTVVAFQFVVVLLVYANCILISLMAVHVKKVS